VITVVGEALIDLVPGESPGSFLARPGGSPFNVAIGLARLGQPTALMARLADNALGRILRQQAAAEGLDLSAAPRASEPTTLAVVSLDAAGGASYDFYLDGTADWQWTAAETERVPAATSVLHFGSLAAWTPPGDALVLALAARMRERALISYDPNVRPALLVEPARAQPPVERAVALAHVVKASAEDVAWLYPGLGAADVAQRWLGLGAQVVVVTDGGNGSTARTAAGVVVQRPARPVTVADTVGAGDAFTAGMLAAALRTGLADAGRIGEASPAQLTDVLDFAATVAALTCARPGADPPRLAEVEDVLVRSPGGAA
jgi:fructokinase